VSRPRPYSVFFCIFPVALILAGPGTGPARPPAVPEFAVLAELLRERQGIDLGAPVADDRGSESVPHFQLFGTDEGTPLAAFEEHADGTVYLAYLAPTGPEWYDVGRADDTEESRNRVIPVGRGRRRFADAQQHNVRLDKWASPARAFPADRGPVPQWLVFPLPLLDSCAADRARLVALEARQAERAHGARALIALVRRPVERTVLERLRRRLASPACRRRRAPDWGTALAAVAGARAQLGVARATPPLPGAGDYCFRDVVSKLDPVLGNSGPPEWQTILPVDSRSAEEDQENGQRRADPDRPLDAPGNHAVSWDELVHLTQTDLARAFRILRWSGHPSREDIKDRPIPWIESAANGVVTNSFLSGADYAGDHYEPPPGYWLGVAPPVAPEGCGTFNAQHALCDDWIVYLRPDPEYGFLLAYDTEREEPEQGLGNFGDDLQANLENEVEQWLFPVGYRPEPGDRIHLVGRWVIDCGHEDWHAELHPIEAYVSAHTRVHVAASGGVEAVASVVVTGDWPGGRLALDVWPPARPAAATRLAWRRDRAGAAPSGLSVAETLEPGATPNHLHLDVVSTAARHPLDTGDWNEVEPHPTRRLAARYHLWWRERSASDTGRVR